MNVLLIIAKRTHFKHYTPNEHTYNHCKTYALLICIQMSARKIIAFPPKNDPIAQTLTGRFFVHCEIGSILYKHFLQAH